MAANESFDALTDSLKLAVATLRDREIDFLLGGSLAAWARGGPRPENDLDLMVKPEQAEAALAALVEAGMRSERPPEEWLYKAYNGEVLIDLIFHPAGLPLTDDVFARGEEMPVLSVATPVMALEDMLLTKLNALDEHSLDYTSLLGIARALREQIEWPALRARAEGSPYAKAFFTLVEELGVAPSATPSAGAHDHVRVVPGV
ncbi:MAG: nucleotidyltransferase family protein [Solirubrobacterales bacterium]|nr:nucleotidyltransferase family protein [Solirubrobacterales bacterium]